MMLGIGQDPGTLLVAPKWLLFNAISRCSFTNFMWENRMYPPIPILSSRLIGDFILLFVKSPLLKSHMSSPFSVAKIRPFPGTLPGWTSLQTASPWLGVWMNIPEIHWNHLSFGARAPFAGPIRTSSRHGDQFPIEQWAGRHRAVVNAAFWHCSSSSVA